MNKKGYAAKNDSRKIRIINVYWAAETIFPEYCIANENFEICRILTNVLKASK